MKCGALLWASALLAATGACSEERAMPPAPPVFDRDVAPILLARCAPCHGDSNPAAGWSATSYLGAIACVSPSGAAATVPVSGQPPILKAQDSEPHRGLLDDSERATLAAWVSGGAPAFRADVHAPGIIDPRSPTFHGTELRKSKWSAMLNPNDPNACGRCHDGAPSRPDGVTSEAPGAPSCTSCHSGAGGVLACSTCHGVDSTGAPPRNRCFFPGDVVGAHAAHVNPSPVRSVGLACGACHPGPGFPVISGLHGDGVVEVRFDPVRVSGQASYDAATGSCTTSCHNRGGAKPIVVWTEAQGPLGCGDCHGSPPAGHFAGPCTGCHSEANASGSALSGGPLHMNGVVDLGDGSGRCGACHGSGDSPWPASGAHPAHRAPALTQPLECSNCHNVPATILDPVHLDGTVHVVFSGLATARGAAPVWTAGRCVDVACHGANLADPPASPAWSDKTNAEAACGACHGIPPSQHTTSTSCNRSDCHGSEVTMDVGGFSHISPSGTSLHIDGVIESSR